MATDTGSNYWLIGGGETPAPPTTLPPEIAALFGPVTASGYAQPPVDPLSYYSPEPQVEASTYTPGAPTRWTDVYRPTTDVQTAPVTPDLSSVETFNPLPQEPVTPAEPEPAAPPTAYEQVAAEEPEVSVLPDWIKEYYVKYGTMPIYTPGTRGDSYIREDGAIVTPGGESSFTPQGPAPTITLPPETVESTPAPQAQVITQPPVFEERVTVTTPPKAPEFEFQEPAPARNPIVLPGTSVFSRPVTTTPLPELPVNPVLTRNMETMPSRYFRDINYDPEEILAAAMRSMGGRMARRSILNELS
jgi:hypothetical protein